MHFDCLSFIAVTAVNAFNPHLAVIEVTLKHG